MGIFSKLFGGDYEPAPIYTDLRNRALALANEPGGDGPHAVLMETGMRGACYTLLAHADGTASLYFSNGGGVIGGGAHPRAGAVGAELLDLALEVEGRFAPCDDAPLPANGETRFWLVKPGAVVSAAAPEKQLGNDRSPLSPLFHKAHELIAVIRHVSQVRESEDPLIVAIFDESVDRVKALLGEGTDPNTRTSSGSTALAMAAAADQAELVDVLVAAGADLGRSDASGLSPLMAAAHAGAEAALLRLLRAEPDLEQKDESGYTALMFAANAGRTACVGRLLEAGADVHATDADRSTPIMFAAQHAHDAAVRLLLERGADPLCEGDHGYSAVRFAEQNGHTSTLQLLLG